GHPGAALGLSGPVGGAHRRAQRHCARPQDRSRTSLRLAGAAQPAGFAGPGARMTSTAFQSRELRAALEAARAAGEVIAPLYRANVAVELKSDRSPVTEADRRAEQVIREVLQSQFP